MTPQELINRGFKIFPLEKGGKKPIQRGSFANATDNLKTIEKWSLQYPGCNWGIATGAASGVVVLDVDPRNGGEASFEQLKKEINGYDDTLAVSTGGGGLHIYFKSPPEGLTTRTNFRPGLDFIAEGKFVVAPGSITTGPYQILNDSSVTELGAELKHIVTPQAIVSTRSSQHEARTEARGNLAAATWKFIAEGAEQGSWNTSLFKAAKDLHEQNYDYDEAVGLLEKPTGYLDETDMKTIESAYSKAPKYEPRLPDQSWLSEGTIPWEQIKEELGLGDVTGGTAPVLITAETLFSEVSDFLRDKGKIEGIKTGLEPLDDLLGGFREKELTVIHGEAKAGKSSFLNKIIHSLLTKGEKVGFASREMVPATEVMPALLSVEFQSNTWKEEYSQELEDKARQLVWLPNLYFAPGYSYFPLEELTEWVLQLAEQNVRVLVFDHLHYGLMTPEDHKEASLYIRQLKTLAMQTGIHFIVVVQANKLGQDEKLGRNSLKGGAAISQTLNSLITIERVKKGEYENAENVMRVELQFARSPLAKPGEFYMQYSRETTDLSIIELQPTQAIPRPPIYGEN